MSTQPNPINQTNPTFIGEFDAAGFEMHLLLRRKKACDKTPSVVPRQMLDDYGAAGDDVIGTQVKPHAGEPASELRFSELRILGAEDERHPLSPQ